MVNGCLKGLTRLALVALVVIAAGVAWWFRDPILHAASRWLGPKRTTLPPVADTAVGAPTPSAVASTGAKMSGLARPAAADSVILSANEMASLIGAGLDWRVRRTFDSLRVELLDGRFAVHARLDTRQIPQSALGPFALMVREREPIRLAGPLGVVSPGHGKWTLEEIAIRGFPFPAPMVRQLAQRMAGADSTGALPVPLPPEVKDIVIKPTGVTIYRRTPR
jgi:hypothetical protein